MVVLIKTIQADFFYIQETVEISLQINLKLQKSKSFKFNDTVAFKFYRDIV